MALPPLEPEEPVPVTAPGWMITFADLLSLLLSFFVLMFATTSVDRQDWERVIAPISEHLTGRAIHAGGAVVTPPAEPARLDLAYVFALFQHLAETSKPLAGASATRRDHAVALALPPGLALGDPAILGDLARLLGSLNNRIEILAHVSGDAPPGAAARDWFRALDQARAAAAALHGLGYQPDLVISGTADLPAGAASRIDIIADDVAAPGASHVAP